MSLSIDPSQFVGDLAARHPGTIRVFQSHGIDFCCGGQRPLSAVCAEKGVEFPALERELRAAAAAPPPERSWADARVADLVAHIVARYHDRLRVELPRLSALMSKVLGVHGPRHPELRVLAATLEALVAELGPHMMKEEQILFPYVSRLEEVDGAGSRIAGSPFGSVSNPIAVMMAEHETAGEALARIRELTRGFRAPEDACNSFRGLYHGLSELDSEMQQHVHLENNVLFPRAVELEARLLGRFAES